MKIWSVQEKPLILHTRILRNEDSYATITKRRATLTEQTFITLFNNKLKTNTMRKILCFLALALFAMAANAEVWKVGERADITQLKAGDVIAMKSITSLLSDEKPSAIWFGCHIVQSKNNFTTGAATNSYGMFPQVKDKSAFKLVEGPGANDKATYYLQEMTSGQYLALTRQDKFSVSLVASTAAATDFAFEKNPYTTDGEWLVHYENGEGWHFTPFHAYGFMYYGKASDMQGFNFYHVSEAENSFMPGEQVSCTEVEDGMEILMNVPYAYYDNGSLGQQYLENRQSAVDEHVYISTVFNQIPALSTSAGYNENNVWVLEYASPATTEGYSAFYRIKSKSTGEYIYRSTEQDRQSSATTAEQGKAMTFTFAPGSVKKYTSGPASLYNDKTITLIPDASAEYPYFGSAHGYGFAIFNNESFANWNIYKLQNVSEEAKKAAAYENLQSKIADCENSSIIIGTTPGYYTEASVNAYNDAIQAAKAVSTTAELSEILDAQAKLEAAFAALEVIPVVDGYYYWTNCRETYKDANGVYPGLYTNAETGYTSFKPFEEGQPEFIFKLTKSDDGNGFYAQNLANGYYMGGDIRESDKKDWYGGFLSCTAEPTFYQIFVLKEPGKYWVTDSEFGTPTSGGVSRCVDTTAPEGNIYRWTARADVITGDQIGYNLNTITPVMIENITIGATGYSTYVSDNALFIPAGVTAYGVTAVEGSELKLAELEGNVLAAGEPVILQGEAGKSYYLIATENEGAEVSGNLLEGTGAEGKAVGENEAYVLYNNEGTAVFRIAAAMTLPAHKAYLPASAVGRATSKVFQLGGDITGISSTETAAPNAKSATHYDLQGRRVIAPQKGQLYIVNGKKVIY